MIDLQKAKNVIKNPATDEIYSQILSARHGNDVLPRERTVEERITTLGNELGHYSAEQLNEIRKQLLESGLVDDKKTLRRANRILDVAPTIKSNQERLTLAFKNKQQ